MAKKNPKPAEPVAEQAAKPERRAVVPFSQLREAFMEVYKAGGTTADLAAKLNMPAVQASARVTLLRKEMKEKLGVQLPHLGRPKVVREERNKAMAEFAKELAELQE